MILQWLAVSSVATWFVISLIRNLTNRPTKVHNQPQRPAPGAQDRQR